MYKRSALSSLIVLVAAGLFASPAEAATTARVTSTNAPGIHPLGSGSTQIQIGHPEHPPHPLQPVAPPSGGHAQSPPGQDNTYAGGAKSKSPN